MNELVLICNAIWYYQGLIELSKANTYLNIFGVKGAESELTEMYFR